MKIDFRVWLDGNSYISPAAGCGSRKGMTITSLGLYVRDEKKNGGFTLKRFATTDEVETVRQRINALLDGLSPPRQES